MASTGELTGGTTATDIETARREKVFQVATQLAATATPNLGAMGFTKAVEALEGRDMSEPDLSAAVYAYAQANGYSNGERREAQSPCYVLNKIAIMATAENRCVSGPIATTREEAGIGKTDFGDSYPTRSQLYAMLDLQEARDAAEPTRESLPFTSPGQPEPVVPDHLVGAYYEERRFSSGVPEVDIVEGTRCLADGTPFDGGESFRYTVSLARTDFGLVES